MTSGLFFNRRPLCSGPEDEKLAQTINGKRQLLLRYSREHSLTRNVMRAAQFQGMSGEDTYAWLAFEALRDLERYEKLVLQDVNTRVPQILVVDPAVQKEAKSG